MLPIHWHAERFTPEVPASMAGGSESPEAAVASLLPAHKQQQSRAMPKQSFLTRLFLRSSCTGGGLPREVVAGQ